MYLEGIEISERLLLNSNARSGTTLVPRDKAHLSTIHPTPLDG